jgi:splicing factor 3B subunit 3
MDVPQHRVPIPRRSHALEDPERGVIIVAAVMHKMKVSRKVFYLMLLLMQS